MENFGFLKNDYRDLYLLCSDVAKYIDSDKSISMLKARQAIEYIVKYLGAETDDLFVNINNLEDKNIANSRLIDLFHLIRKKANKNVHNAINADTEGVLDALIEICVWLTVGHDKKSISVIKFTDKEKYFLKKYGQYEAGDLEEEIDVVDTINPLEVVGKFSNEDVETADVLEQDVFETYEEYCERIESLPAIKIGYAFLDSSQIDGYCEIAFPLFHVSKHPKIESASVAAFYVSDIEKGKNIDGIIKAKLKIFEEKIYYDYDSVTLQDDDSEIKLYPISWEKYGYEAEEQFAGRLKSLPLLPVGIAKPIRKEYDLKKQVLPFETIPVAYVSKLFLRRKIDCSLKRDDAKVICSAKTSFRVYAKFNDLHTLFDFQIQNQEIDTVLILLGNNTIKTSCTKLKFDRFLRDAEQGNAEAQYKLAVCYEDGHGTEEDREKAFEWYKKSAEQGKVEAQYKLAECYECGSGTEKDEEKAFEWYKKSAEQGKVEAQYKLAECYEFGSGTEEDEEKAFEWYKKSAEQGDVDAQYKLAVCYEEGQGTTKNEEKAFEWYKKLAEQGDKEAQYELAECYEEGKGTTKNEEKAFEWYKKLVEQGYRIAQYKLAVCYEEGKGTTKDEIKAFEWYKKLAEQGNKEAQYELAERYELGLGTSKDDTKAFEWYKKSAEQGNDKAQSKVAFLNFKNKCI